ncbi:MAG TPA: aconitate hydratase AcnA [Candidatus Aquilonibacter sp.]|jgi:aconitate hydratase|nr:aconitate hydratase AcnA [Candidatus Aquilonibacter sp.]
MSLNSFNSRSNLKVGNKEYEIYRLDSLDKQGISTKHLPYSLRILLENLLRTEDGRNVTQQEIRALAAWNKNSKPDKEIAFTPSRVLLQDFTGVPCVVDLAAMRDAMQQLGGDPALINPLQPVELVIDHSVQVDEFGSANAFDVNALLEFQRNKERYSFLRWGQTGFRNLAIVPPDTGIVHQVNLEYLARVVFVNEANGKRIASPDTLVGTDSHSTMINGLGVLGWGVGGIEAEAAMLGQPVSMLIPLVVGVKLTGRLREGATATDLVLTITEMLRKHGVVGKFVEYFGPGLADLPLADRATIANMSPEYGATCGIFPVDKESLKYLKLSGRSAEQIALVEAYCREQGMFHDEKTPEAEYSELLSLDLATVEPSLAGPKRPQDRVVLSNAGESFNKALPSLIKPKSGTRTATPEIPGLATDARPGAPQKSWETEGGSPAAIGVEDPNVHEHVSASVKDSLKHGSVVIAAITSCTNTSNPSVMIGAGILAKKAVEKGLQVPAWVKTSLAPGSKVVRDYLENAGLTPYLEKLKFHIVGYGCTTCIGNSGPLPEEVSKAIDEKDLVVASVLSGNRNFEGRINSEVRANYLMSPPLVVAFALAGRIDTDLRKDAIGKGKDGKPVYLADIWPTQREVEEAVEKSVTAEMFSKSYAEVFAGDERWRGLSVPKGQTYAWEKDSTYIRRAPYFDDMKLQPAPVADINSARVLAVLGDSVTTDHISPAGSIKKDGAAGKYLQEHGVKPADFNSYGSRRGNHEVMVRGTFANVRLRNKLVATEGGFTRHLPSNTEMSIFDASQKYIAEGTPLIILAGKEYGSGSSRDWAAKGPRLLGVQAVIAESYERIHRSNLVGMGILPLQFPAGQNAESLGLTGEEVFQITGIRNLVEHYSAGQKVKVLALGRAGDPSARRYVEFEAIVRIDTPQEALYYANGGILQYVLRQLLAGKPEAVGV